MMDERKDARTDGRTWATLNALPHSTNSGGIKKLTEVPEYAETRHVMMMSLNITMMSLHAHVREFQYNQRTALTRQPG